ncbi:NAD(P)/FAD-dependent oxidoreductase [Pantoea sp. B65]|uniref:NAD(P)/FAD-dependent oxidoreductase n=1 Tax=Pantoea sp. B65 TaxID=2813359 RepID=UPI0039B5BA5E
MNVAVIGGGVIGVSSALHLARGGAKVQLFTEAELASGASGRSLSWLNASGLWPADYYQLRMAGIDRFRTLYCNHPELSWLKFDGGVYWSDNNNEVRQWYTAESARGYDAQLLSAQQVADLDQAITPAAVIEPAISNPGEGWVNLPDFIAHCIAEFTHLGGTLIENAGKTVPLYDAQQGVTGVHSQNNGEFLCDKVLLACGASTVRLLAELGVDLPDGSVLSMLAITDPVDQRPAVVLNTPRVAMRPHPGKALAVDHSWYTDEIKPDAAGNFSVPDAVINELLAAADQILSTSGALSLASYKAGWKPVPADGFPVLGELEPLPGIYLAFTHSGATLSLIIGELLSQEIITGKPHPMLASFRPGRFMTR